MKLNTIAENLGYKHHGLAIWWDITLTKKTAWGSWISASAPYINSPFEGILILYKNHWKKQNEGITNIDKYEFMKGCSGVWKIAPEHDRAHPAPFPIRLAERCVNLFSYESDLILDPFSGSGTTAIACHNLKRNFICIEKDKDYWQKSVKRYEEHIKQTRIDFEK